MAVVLNSVNDDGNTVDLSEVAFGHLNLFLLTLVGVFGLLGFCTFIAFFCFCLLVWYWCFFLFFTFLLVEGFFGIALKV